MATYNGIEIPEIPTLASTAGGSAIDQRARLKAMITGATGLPYDQYVAQRTTNLTNAGLPVSPSSLVTTAGVRNPPTLTPMPTMPAAPTLPNFQMPNIQMPTLPKLQEVAPMPFVGDAAGQAAAARAREAIANRKGRRSTFLTTSKPTPSTRPTIASAAPSRYARVTKG